MVLPDFKELALKTETLDGAKNSKPNETGLQIKIVDKGEQIDALRLRNNLEGYSRGFRGGLS
jgi:hypothetical protein